MSGIARKVGAFGCYQGLRLILQVANELFHCCLVAIANAAAQIEVFLKIGNGGFGAGRVAFIAPSSPPVVVGLGIIRLEADRFGAIVQSGIEVALGGARTEDAVRGSALSP
jgi:hypothetical protein